MKKSHPEESKMEYEKLRQAIANLSTLVDIELPFEVSAIDEDTIVAKTEEARSSDFSYLSGRAQSPDKSVEAVKNTFKTILEYLRRIHQKQGRGHLDKSFIEGIQTIMVLVGEAANKMDRYTNLFKKVYGGSITNLKEYKDLQDFYTRTISKDSNEALLDLDFADFSNGPAMTDLNAEYSEVLEEEKKALSEVEIVKNDTEYELFYLQREDGEHFYSSDLLRRMKAASGLSEYSGEFAGDDPFVQIKNWDDKSIQVCASQILKALKSPMETYYRSALKIRDMDLVIILNKALMALMMAANPKNLLRHFSVKTCSQYFKDFQMYFREAIQSLDYHKLIDKPPKKSQVFLCSLVEVMHGICHGLFTHVAPTQEPVRGVQKLIGKGLAGAHPPLKNQLSELAIAEYLETDFKSLDSVLKQYPNGPLFKALDLFLEGDIKGFDPLMLDNLPCQLYSIDSEGLYTTNLRMPSPTSQVMINQAVPTEEFKGFLRDYSAGPIRKRHLIINLQDRTSWKEHARCEALEQLQHQAEFNDSLMVVTLAKETDFYYQLGPYQDLNHAKPFIEQFKEHLSSEQTGFYFPKKVEKALFPDFIDPMLKAVHKVFFFGKNVLSRRQRLDFIEIAYLFIQCKLIDLTNAYSFSFVCKDGIDTSAISAAQLFLFFKLLNGKDISEHDIEHIRFMLFAPALMIRERIVNEERFNRMLHMLKLVENEIHRTSQASLQHFVEVEFGGLFTKPLLNASLNLPRLSSQEG